MAAPFKKREEETTSIQVELRIMEQIIKPFQLLSEPAKHRVMAYFVSRFHEYTPYMPTASYQTIDQQS